MRTVKFNDLSAQWASISNETMPKIKEFLEEGYYIGGKHVEAFEAEFAAYTGSKCAIGTSNGSDGLKLAIEALNLRGRVDVILPANGFMADVFAAKYQVNAEYKVTFIDNDEYFQMDVDKLKAHLQGQNRGWSTIILPVHLYGHPSNMDQIHELARMHGAYLIEDASQAQGAKCNGKMVGSWGDITVYSLYPGKNLGAAGDAGVITTNNETLRDRLFMLRNYGSPQKYHHDIDGWNHRLDPIQAIILSAKLPHLDAWNARRREIHDMYQAKLEHLNVWSVHNLENHSDPTRKLFLPKTAPYASENVHHIFPILCYKRDELMKFLETKGIPTIIHYPIALEKCLCNDGMKIDYKNSNALRNADMLLSLPIHPFMENDEVEYVCASINEFFA
jgi:dTDP-4-amino-4,6-dideoxygalactose transaminase